MSQDQIEEHGLVLAIQAAHLHSIGIKESAMVHTYQLSRRFLYLALPSLAVLIQVLYALLVLYNECDRSTILEI
jgi:hypothetical protein